MHRMIAVIALICSLLVVGCDQPGPPQIAPPTEQQIGQQTSTMVSGFVEQAKKSPKSAEAELGLLLEALEARAAEQGGKFVDVRDAAKELLALYGQSGKEAQINEGLDKLQQLAQSLAEN